MARYIFQAIKLMTSTTHGTKKLRVIEN